jgi:Protein of unknown function (DUF2933)
VCLGLLAAGVLLLLIDHAAHVLLPYLLILACPLAHLFMHHGHSRRGGPKSRKRRQNVPVILADVSGY